jgi:hypothetical protein
VDTWAGNLGLDVVGALVAVTAAAARAAYAPGSWSGRSDPVLVAVSSGLWEAVTSPFGPLLVITAGL